MLRSFLALFLLMLTTLVQAQAPPYGLTERVANTTFLLSTPNNISNTISESGLFTDIAAQTVAPGLIPFTVNSVLWSDGASKRRFLALPDTTKIVFSKDGVWQFPPNAVIVKSFYLELERGNPASRKIVETRFLVRQQNFADWDGYSYMWNDEQTDATLLPSSATKKFTIIDAQAPGGSFEQSYYFPSRDDCLRCHTEAAGRLLGVRTAQLNKQHQYANISDNQLRSFNHIRLFTTDIGEDYTDFPQLINHMDEQADLTARARSYLDENCADCHRPGGTGVTNMDLRFITPLLETNAFDRSPLLGDLGVPGSRIIKPGQPDSSILYLRTQKLDFFRMPPLATSIIDKRGTDLLRRWIVSLDPATSVRNENPPNNVPSGFRLHNAYPNPFNPATNIRYDIAENAYVNLVILDLLGKEVKTLVNEIKIAGSYTVNWDATDSQGRPVSTGTYFYQLQTGKFWKTRKMVLLK